MNKPEIYKKDQKYNIIYSDQDGKDNEFKFTPDEDMSKPKMIMKCKEANKNFVKLKEIKKLEEGVHKMEENNEIKTLANLILDRHQKGLEGLDIGDNTIDMIVYFDYDENSNDSYDKCLATIAKGTKIIRADEDYAVVDLFNYVKDHLDAFNEVLNIEGETEDDKAADVVENNLEGLFSGYTNDSTYNSLNSALEGVQKKDEGLFHKEYVVYGSIGGSQGYIGNDIEKGEDNLYKNADDGKKFDSEEEARKAAKRIETEFNANEVSVLPLKKALKYDKKEESFEDSKKFMAGEILAIIDRYINTSDLENLFKEMGIDQSIYEGDQDIPEGKIQDIVEIGLQWLFDHLQPEDYKRVLKNDLEMTDEEMEKYGVELDESKKIEEGSNYGGLINSGEDQIFGSITNTEVYERLQGIRDYLQDYYEEVKKNSINYQAEQHPEELKVAANKVREAVEALDRAWEE